MYSACHGDFSVSFNKVFFNLTHCTFPTLIHPSIHLKVKNRWVTNSKIAKPGSSINESLIYIYGVNIVRDHFRG